ncbi:MAG: Uma2 family endonuclease [Spirulinaceae cyanobacterium RM2_2_10]|nr:Uma2 family endonuclease [Spirulinaceae cyanobacterium SM2_1_0]NJO19059.1 Uma2 family endonuclease [Spirulinaceae cyanobacterium RM2_2_10]
MTLTPLRPIAEPEYPDSDGKPMAESDPARDSLTYAVEALKLYFAARPDVYVSGNLFIFYARGFADAVVSPDVFVVFGVEKRDRPSYKLWEENGITPDLVIEITSKSTRHTDSVDKPDKYIKLGVTEYFQYDPTGDYLDPPLLGFRLVDGKYEPMTSGGTGDGMIVIRSAVLGLELRLEGGRLRFFDPETSKYLLSYQEEHAGRLRAEAERQEAVEERYKTAERLLAMAMSVEQVAALTNLDADDLRRRFGG